MAILSNFLLISMSRKHHIGQSEGKRLKAAVEEEDGGEEEEEEEGAKEEAPDQEEEERKKQKENRGSHKPRPD